MKQARNGYATYHPWQAAPVDRTQLLSQQRMAAEAAERLACSWRRAAAAHAAAVRGRGALEHAAAAAGEWGEPAAKRSRLGGAAGEAAAQGLQLLARGLQLLHEAAWCAPNLAPADAVHTPGATPLPAPPRDEPSLVAKLQAAGAAVLGGTHAPLSWPM